MSIKSLADINAANTAKYSGKTQDAYTAPAGSRIIEEYVEDDGGAGVELFQRADGKYGVRVWAGPNKAGVGGMPITMFDDLSKARALFGRMI